MTCSPIRFTFPEIPPRNENHRRIVRRHRGRLRKLRLPQSKSIDCLLIDLPLNCVTVLVLPQFEGGFSSILPSDGDLQGRSTQSLPVASSLPC